MQAPPHSGFPMVKVKFGKEQFEALKKFEAQHHPDIWKWILEKVGKTDGVDILDVSEEPSVFSLQLAEQFPATNVVCAVRGDLPDFPLPGRVTLKKVDFHRGFSQLEELGKFDVILLKEITHEISDLAAFFRALRERLKDPSSGKIIILGRPKNPPLPLPEVCLLLWRKLAPTKEEIMAAANAAELSTTVFSAAVPVSVDKKEWENILYSGCFPAVKNTLKCGEREIRDFCQSKPPKIAFEEKISIFVLKP